MTAETDRALPEVGHTHDEPMWVYDDGSGECPYDRVTEARHDDHVIVDGPWEAATDA